MEGKGWHVLPPKYTVCSCYITCQLSSAESAIYPLPNTWAHRCPPLAFVTVTVIDRRESTTIPPIQKARPSLHPWLPATIYWWHDECFSLMPLGSPAGCLSLVDCSQASSGDTEVFKNTPTVLPCLIHSYQHHTYYRISVTAVLRKSHHPNNICSVVVLLWSLSIDGVLSITYALHLVIIHIQNNYT